MTYVFQEYPKVVTDQHGEPVTVKSAEEEEKYKPSTTGLPSAADLDAVEEEKKVAQVTSTKVRVVRGSKAK